MARIYPYETLFGDLELTVTGVKVDDAKPGSDPVDAQFNLINFFTLERDDWKYATISVALVAPADEVAGLDEEGLDPGVTLIAFSTATNSRQAIRLDRSATDPVRWLGQIELHRDNYRGRVELWAVLTATVDGIPYRWMGETDRWAVYFDEPPVLPIEGTLRVQWAHFKTDRPDVVPEDASDEAFYVDLESTVPAVYLNADLQGLPDLLGEERRRPAAEKALRDAEYRRIATAAWTEIFNVAVAAIRPGEDDEEPEWPIVEWQKKALQSLLPRIYDMTAAEALAQAHADATGDGALGLHSRAQVAIAKEIGASRSLRRNLDDLDKLNTKEAQS